VNVLELSNAETGAFRVRLLRRGERYGRHHQLTWDKDEPAIEFYGPAADGERPADAQFLGRWGAAQFSRPKADWSSVGWGGYCSVSPDNTRTIAEWLAQELELPWTPPPPPERPASQARANRPIELHDAGNRRVTLYVRGAFGYERIEAKWVRVDRRPYAQYADAIFVEFQPRRTRLARVMRLTSRPDLVILLGWDHPDLQQATESTQQTMTIGQHTTTYTVTQTKYASADARYPQEFESALDAHLTSLPLTQLLLDLRGETITQRPSSTGRPVEAVVPVFHPSGVREREPEDTRAAVFVSYHHGRDARARERFERDHGTVIRSSSIYPGEISRGPEVRREIRRRIVGCDFLVILVGRETYTRRWVDWEINAALTRGPDGAPRPVVGVLLPESADLGGFLPPDRPVRPGESVGTLRRRSDELAAEMLAATGTTLPARLLDNLLGGYALLVPWPASPAALRGTLASATGRARPVNGRRLLARNLPSTSDLAAAQDEPVPDEPNGEEAAAAPEAPIPITPDPVPPARPTVDEPVQPGDDPAWLVCALQRYGPRAVLAGLDGGNVRHRRLAAALRPHAHLLEPLDSEVSIAATLAARLDEIDIGTGLAAVFGAPHLVPVSPLPDRPSPGLLRVLPGTHGGITAMVADPAGQWLATLSSVGEVHVWDIATGAVRHVLTRPDGAAANSGRMLVADPSGAWLASAGPEGLVEIWDPAAGTRLHAFASVYGGIEAMAVDPRGAWLAAADAIGIIQWRSMPSGQPLREKSSGSPGVQTMVVDPAGRWLAVGRASAVDVWDADTGERLREFAAPGFVVALAFGSRGDWLACAGDRPTVRVWSMPEGTPARDLTNRARVTNKRVRCLAADPGGSWLAAGGHEGPVRIWSPDSGDRQHVLEGHRGGWDDAVQAFAVAPDGSWLASGGSDRTVRIWDVVTGAERACFTGHTGGITQLATGPGGRWLAAGSSEGTVRLWDPATPSRSMDVPTRRVTALAADPGGSWHAYAGGADGSITIGTVRGDLVHSTASHESHGRGAVTAMLADPRGNWLASAGRDGTLRIWDPRDGSEQYALIGRGHRETKEIATRLAAAPDGQWLAGYGDGPKLWIWSPTTGERRNTLWAAGGRLWDVAVDPGGTWLATAANDGAVRLWRPSASQPHRVLTGHQGPVRAVAVHPTGAYLVSAGEDATVRTWNLEDDTAAVWTVPVPAGRLAMGPHGGWFASAGAENAVRVWDPDGGHRLLAGHTAPVTDISPDPTGQYLASVAPDGTVRIWEPATGAAVASMRVDGALTGVRWVSDRLIVGGAQGVYQFRVAAAG